METTKALFDLNEAIQQWRTRLGESPAFQRENLDELETHLRDSIANLEQRGLAADEAFLIATRRVGSDTMLGKEFGKINSRDLWLNRALWMLIGIQIVSLVRSLVSTISSAVSLGTVTLGGKFASMPVYTGLLCGIVHLLTFAILMTAGWRLLLSKSGSIFSWLRSGSNSSVRLGVFLAGWFVLNLFSGVILRGAFDLFSVRYHPNSPKFLIGPSYGSNFASFIESIALIVLTLLLARRQLFAKTRA